MPNRSRLGPKWAILYGLLVRAGYSGKICLERGREKVHLPEGVT